jgi:hypothetical protein
MVHNGCHFSKVDYFNDKVVIKIQSIDGKYLEGANEETPSTLYITESIDNLTTNFGGGFDEWVKNY